VVRQEGDGGESGGSLPAMLGGAGGEHAGELAVEPAGLPEAAGRVEEGRGGGGDAAVAGRGAEEESCADGGAGE